MEPVEGTRDFQASGDAYDGFMGRYSRPLGPLFARFADVAAGQRVLDLGCGPGALTATLVDLVGADGVTAVDPAPPFVADCSARFPDVTVRAGRAEKIPADDASFDRSLSQLVLHFVTDADAAARELRRVVRPGGVVAACVWDFAKGMEMLRAFWDAALMIDPEAPDEARTLRFGRPGEIAELFAAAGLTDIAETTLQVTTTYRDFDELWSTILSGVGPAGAYCAKLSDAQQEQLRANLFARVGSPEGAFSMSAIARAARATVPG